MATSKLSDEELAKKYFDMFDKDGDGKIAKSELKDLLVAFCNMDETEPSIEQVLKEYDNDNSGFIELPELTQMYCKMNIRKKDKSLYELFTEIDEDKNGTINEEEVKKFLVVMGCQAKDEYVKKIMAESDKDNNGEISLSEFCAMCRKYQPAFSSK